MTEELCSRYERLLEIWFDAGVKIPSEGGRMYCQYLKNINPTDFFTTVHKGQTSDE